MVQDSNDFICIDNNIGDEEYTYLIAKNTVVSIKMSNYLDNKGFYSIDIQLYRDNMSLVYKDKNIMIKDFNQLKIILGFDNA